MSMDHLIGQRFNLISKSEIRFVFFPLPWSHLARLTPILFRYVGTLHEINAEQSTIALENVFSFGTEDRQVAKFIPPSQEKYGFIVFRGSDVKDIKIAEEEPAAPSPQQNIPNDPAILVRISSLLCSLRPSQPLKMMKHFGCKLTDLFLMRNLMWILSVAFLLISTHHPSAPYLCITALSIMILTLDVDLRTPLALGLLDLPHKVMTVHFHRRAFLHRHISGATTLLASSAEAMVRRQEALDPALVSVLMALLRRATSAVLQDKAFHLALLALLASTSSLLSAPLASALPSNIPSTASNPPKAIP